MEYYSINHTGRDGQLYLYEVVPEAPTAQDFSKKLPPSSLGYVRALSKWSITTSTTLAVMASSMCSRSYQKRQQPKRSARSCRHPHHHHLSVPKMARRHDLSHLLLSLTLPPSAVSSCLRKWTDQIPQHGAHARARSPVSRPPPPPPTLASSTIRPVGHRRC
jgi:hypothetical protein